MSSDIIIWSYIFGTFHCKSHFMKQKKHIFRYFFIIFWRGRGTMWLNSVFLKDYFHVNIVHNNR